MNRFSGGILRLWLCFFLAIGAVAPAAHADSNEELLRFIIAEQAEGAASFDTCSYTMTIQGYEIDEGLRFPIETRATVKKQSGAIDMAKEHIVVNQLEDGSLLNIAPRAERLVLNDEMLAIWDDQTKAQLHVFFNADWQVAGDSLLAQRAAHELVFDPEVLAYSSAEISGALYEYIRKTLDSPDTTRFRWSVETIAGPDGQPETFVLHRTINKDGKPLPDMTVHLDATRNCVVTKCVSEPPNSSVSSKETTTKEYQRVGDAWLVKRMEYIETTNENVEPTEKLVVTFQDFETTTPAPIENFTLAAMDLPSRMAVLVGEPGPKGGAVMKAGQLELRDGELQPLAQKTLEAEKVATN